MNKLDYHNVKKILAGKKILVTGHTGFKGSWLSIWLNDLGASVSGYSLKPPTSPSNFEICGVENLLRGHYIGDIRDKRNLDSVIKDVLPEIIFHLAAQPIVKDGYIDPIMTLETNVLGTANVLEAVRRNDHPCAIVVVTSDKCYRNEEQVWGYRESDALGGYDPYSASKAAAEIVAESYRSSFFNTKDYSRHGVSLATARSGNVIGGGDWAPGRIMTDIIQSLNSSSPITLRNPNSIRPWQHVVEPLFGYLVLAAHLLNEPDGPACSAWNFGPLSDSAVSVRSIAELAIRDWGRGGVENRSPLPQLHEASILRLSIDKASAQLGWSPIWNVQESVKRCVDWYRAFYAGQGIDMLDITRSDIASYTLER